MTITDLNIGDKGRILSMLLGDKAYRQRLISMGLIPGTEFQITRYAPFGDPIEIAVRGFALSLRGAEAAILQVEKV
jgi:ferrous iron transport protein A